MIQATPFAFSRAGTASKPQSSFFRFDESGLHGLLLSPELSWCDPKTMSHGTEKKQSAMKAGVCLKQHEHHRNDDINSNTINIKNNDDGGSEDRTKVHYQARNPTMIVSRAPLIPAPSSASILTYNFHASPS